ncbi:MAG TPA: CCA tRNA nucleotidyltransferase [Gemmatimonadales bacterium]|nr:CCA tRNA nucleotidyltransferase [Gemmatimonadales bacterium]
MADSGSGERGAVAAGGTVDALWRSRSLPAPRSPMSFPEALHIPQEVLRIARRLEEEGYETWCVGGAVRDTLLGLENHDFDLTTAAVPEVVQRLFRRTVPVGIEHGTVAVLDSHNRPHEVTTFRRDVQTDGRHARVEFGVSLTDDLARRDFTINAIAYHPLRHEWRDPFNGAADLERKVIRAVGDPNWRFQEDYLRILRALRFSARFEFRIHAATREAARANVQGLAQLSAERVRDEWFKGIETARRVSRLVALWREIGAVRIWLPELRKAGSGDPEGRRRGVVDKLPRDPVLISSYLSSDPASLLTRLRCANRDIERGRAIRDWRDKYPDPKHLPAVRRWLFQTGPAADDLLALLVATTPRSPLPKVVAAVREARDPLSLKDLVVHGEDLIAAGVRPGPEVGEMLARLLDDVLEDPGRNTRHHLLARVRDWLQPA